MTHVHQLRHSAGSSGLPALQPNLSLVRSSDSATRGGLAVAGKRGQGKTTRKRRNLGRIRTQRAGASAVVQGSASVCADWPGREYGIREPHPQETALTWDEVFVFLRLGSKND